MKTIIIDNKDKKTLFETCLFMENVGDHFLMMRKCERAQQYRVIESIQMYFIDAGEIEGKLDERLVYVELDEPKEQQTGSRLEGDLLILDLAHDRAAHNAVKIYNDLAVSELSEAAMQKVQFIRSHGIDKA